MPPKKSTAGKSQQLTLRIDDKTRFQLDFAARITGMSITTFVERAIQQSVDEITVLDTNRDNEEISKNWRYYWDPHEGIRETQLLTSHELAKYRSYEEDEFSTFLFYHWRYIGIDKKLSDLVAEHIYALWDHLHDLNKEWQLNKNIDRNCVVPKLDKILADADLAILDEEIIEKIKKDNS